MATPKITFDEKKFQALAGKAYIPVVEEAIEEMQKQLTEKRRPYPADRVTKRKSGQVVIGGPRDVVDLGKLSRSKKVKKATVAQFGTKKIPVSVEWTAEHGMDIYLGTDKQPAYPWVQVALRRIDLAQMYRQEYQKVTAGMR